MGGNTKTGIDCSHFVYQTINGARERISFGGPAPQLVAYETTSSIEGSGLFVAVTTPQAGDLVLWDGHVGIVLDPKTGRFIGAQNSTGVAEANYLTGYWAKREKRRFLRFYFFL